MDQMRHQNEVDLQSLEHEYKAIAPIAESLCKELVNQLGSLLEEADIILGFPIQSRIKRWESLVEKLDRVPLHIRGIKGIQDLVGLRLILLFSRDTEKVVNLISRHLNVVRQYDTLGRLKEDQFGYSSTHLVVDISDKQTGLVDDAQINGLMAEIQVRTLAQHTWAEASHKLQYKQEENINPKMRRAISRISALLEIIDLEFERLLEQRDSYRDDANISGTEEELNVDLLGKTLDFSLPKLNKQDNERYAELLADLRLSGIRTQGDLTNLIRKHLDSALADDSKRVGEEMRLLGEEGFSFGATPERLAKGVYYNHVGLVKIMLQFAK